jgi:periplasmic protein CpxP/Spy
VHAYNIHSRAEEGFAKMSRFIGRFILVGLLSSSLIIASSHNGPASAQQSAGAVLAQARPAPPPPNVEANIANLRRTLQITPAQEGAFNTFATVMRENEKAEAGVPHQPPANASAVDELRAELQYDEVELAGLKRLLPALEGLYSVLSPAQRQAADAAFRQGPGG